MAICTKQPLTRKDGLGTLWTFYLNSMRKRSLWEMIS